jgi:hypothetical protein
LPVAPVTSGSGSKYRLFNSLGSLDELPWKKFKLELVFMRGVLLPVISIIGVAASQTPAASTPIENVRRDKFFLVIMKE